MRQHRGFASFSDKPSEDQTRYLSNGRTLRIRKDPRFGFWTCSIDAGQLPETLKGRYTSFVQAIRVANQVYGSRGLSIHVEPQEQYSSSVNDVREEMGLERK